MITHGIERTEEFRETWGAVSVHVFILLQFLIIGLFFYGRVRWNLTSKDFMKAAFSSSVSFSRCSLIAIFSLPFALSVFEAQSVFEMCFWGILLAAFMSFLLSPSKHEEDCKKEDCKKEETRANIFKTLRY